MKKRENYMSSRKETAEGVVEKLSCHTLNWRMGAERKVADKHNCGGTELSLLVLASSRAVSSSGEPLRDLLHK